MTPEQFHARIWEILEPVDSAAFEVVAAPAPDASAVAAVEAATGFPVPEVFAAFAQRTNGLCIMAREAAWPQAKLYDVGPAWTFWRGLVMLGFAVEDLPEWAGIAAVQRELATVEVRGVLPLLKVVGDGGRVWGIDSNGAVVLVSDGEATCLESDFTEVFAEQVEALAQRQQDMARRIAQRKR